MRHFLGSALRLAFVPVAGIILAGCATEPVSTASYPSGTYSTVSTRDVVYPNGTYKYMDDATQPYWLWVPNGVSIGSIPPPPAVPVATRTAAVVIQPTVPARTVVAGAGQYVLYGDGNMTPYQWVWVPSGVTAPPPPPLPRR
jgi:hypothetical protein